jgi:hypothetical protein
VRKAISTMLVAAIPLIALGTPVGAAVITYSCVEPSALTAAFIIRADTKTHEATETDAGADADTPPVSGTAQISSTRLVVTIGRAWNIQINRSTGESLDSDGSSGTCELAQ